MANTCSSAFHDDPLHPSPAQRENIYHVDVHVQVTAMSLASRVGLTICSGSHSSFIHLLFNCMALTSFGMLSVVSFEDELHGFSQHRLRLYG
jgi:hypothetical protein